MTTINLSTRDLNVLEKIKDPESNPGTGIVLDSSLPRDPHIRDAAAYEAVVQRERDIIRAIQALETRLSTSQTAENKDAAVQAYRQCVSQLDGLISDYPDYASARNNRAQISRRLYGDAMLLANTATTPMPLIEKPDPVEKTEAAVRALADMERSIALLSPASLSTPISPQTARTLSMAHTQRAAIYLRTAKQMPDSALDVDDKLAESRWAVLDFEEAASRDLALGGRYGNEIAKGLAVSVNPTAKLCGQMVREAMKKEYGPSFEG